MITCYFIGNYLNLGSPALAFNGQEGSYPIDKGFLV
jgi:hypothetical protein